MSELEEPWGQLISLQADQDERIPIVSSKFVIGRAKDCDLPLCNNKFVSGTHCELERDSDNCLWLRDKSTNGTVLNESRINRDRVKLKTGSVIKIVFRQNSPSSNVSFKFIDLRPHSDSVPLDSTLRTDPDSTLDLTDEFTDGDDGTAPFTLTVSADARASSPSSQGSDIKFKRKAIEEAEGTPANKRTSSGLKESTKEVGQVPDATGDFVLPKPELEKKDSIEETLICQICQEILYDCISLQPCMHSYCAGCYSDWMAYSKQCPACRNNVDRVSKNHIVNNLVEAYLRANPAKRRPAEDLAELDAKNKIGKDILYPKRIPHKHVVYSSSEESDDTDSARPLSSNSSEDSSESGPSPYLSATTHAAMASHGLGAIGTPAPVGQCRQCPGFLFPSPTGSHTPPPYTCTPVSNHILCHCCLQPMPDRRNTTDISVPPQKCDVCSNMFCHMYWGCVKFGCRGCLNHFKDMDFDNAVLNSIINENAYESRVLLNYLGSNDLTVKDLLQACLQKLDTHDYTSSDSRSALISSESRICYSCAVKNFHDLAYQYRRDIPNDELPAEVTSRPNCYYGNNCRTQKHNPAHAEKFNHICTQTKY